MSGAGDKIWYEDVRILTARWREFFPAPHHTSAEKVNALVRLVLYVALATFVYNREVRTLVLGGGVIAVLSFAFGHRTTERLTPEAPLPTTECTKPTRDNPFANVLLTDLGKPRAPACAYDSVKDELRAHFNDGLIRNATDVYEKENSQHQYYTMPVTTTIPDTHAFANFLYGGMKSCKENAEHCPSRM